LINWLDRKEQIATLPVLRAAWALASAHKKGDFTMPILFWLLGVPIPIILLFLLFAR
jgi:hypothetical protein